MTEIQTTETLLRHAQTLYDGLMETAVEEEIGEKKLTVHRGSLSKVYDGLGISRSYYTRLRAFMTDNNFMHIVQSGSRSVESIIVLLQRPTAEGISLPPLTGRSHGARVEARLDKLEDSIGGLRIKEALSDHEERLKALERKSRARGGRVSGKD